MAQQAADLAVTTHVGRDVLAQAAQFKTEATAVWEYVVNSLQYVDAGVQPKVEVTAKRSSISVSDNGTGMDQQMLRHFFTMHGENLERRSGRIGRGKWGTGKSAAFGIANALAVDTVRDGRRNVVRLTRAMIESSDGDAITLDWQVRDETVNAPNGTTVTLSDLLLPRVDKSAIINYIERNLSAFRGTNPRVAVNSHVCEYHPPTVQKTRRFTPNATQAATLGDVELVVHASTKPLQPGEYGVTVLAGEGNLVAIEDGGVQHKEYGNYLFGEINVPALETHETPLEPFDASRSLTLNPAHPVVAVLVGFIGSSLEKVRRQLIADEKSAREEEEARRLAKHGDDLADILNQHFTSQMQRLRDIRAATSRPGSAAAAYGAGEEGGQESDLWVEGLDEPGALDAPSNDGETGTGGGRPGTGDPQGGTSSRRWHRASANAVVVVNTLTFRACTRPTRSPMEVTSRTSRLKVKATYCQPITSANMAPAAKRSCSKLLVASSTTAMSAYATPMRSETYSSAVQCCTTGRRCSRS